MNISFWFDVVSPYSYLASTLLSALSSSTGASFVWRPLLLREVFAAYDVDHALLEDDTRWVRRDLGLWAKRYGVPLEIPERFSLASDGAMAALAGLPHEQIPDVASRLFSAHWVEGRDVCDPATLADVLGPTLAPTATCEHSQQRLRERTAEALSRKVFGVPSFFVGDTYFFGNDRLMFVEAEIRSQESPSA